MAAIIAFSLGVGVSFAVSVHHKLVTLDQFDTFLTSAATFITATCGSLYGMNKLAAWGTDKNKQDDKDAQ